jgi:hypothetical protein
MLAPLPGATECGATVRLRSCPAQYCTLPTWYSIDGSSSLSNPPSHTPDLPSIGPSIDHTVMPKASRRQAGCPESASYWTGRDWTGLDCIGREQPATSESSAGFVLLPTQSPIFSFAPLALARRVVRIRFCRFCLPRDAMTWVCQMRYWHP